ncbi:MAG TPA: aminotransferase class III-fold pyridoxal phosphate-dependent enzyme, partial [Chloroflexota bacterium]
MVSTRQRTDWRELEARRYMKTFNRLPVVLVRGQGCRVWDESGKEYLDLVAGIAVNALGHAHPDLVKAITDQAGQLIHTSNLYYSTPQ